MGRAYPDYDRDGVPSGGYTPIKPDGTSDERWAQILQLQETGCLNHDALTKEETLALDPGYFTDLNDFIHRVLSSPR